MTNSSEEGKDAGLGWVNASTKKFDFGPETGLKVPHIGWNRIKIQHQVPLVSNLSDVAKFYFVHSYYISCHDSNDIVSSTTYGIEFTSIFARGNVYGCQFHPEKSHKYGMSLLKNFITFKSMLQNRVMPCLLLKDNKLVKTIKFKQSNYVGDPVNAIKIYNEKEVDQLIVTDISANRPIKGPDFDLIQTTFE